MRVKSRADARVLELAEALKTLRECIANDAKLQVILSKADSIVVRTLPVKAHSAHRSLLQ